MSFLSENTVKRVALKYLKAYYKYRPRRNEIRTLTSLDMRTEGGIIADGYYRFRKPDGTFFTATFEATSYHTKNEIQYKLQKAVLFWDGLAISSVISAILFIYGYTGDHFTIKQIGVGPAFGIYLVAQSAVFLMFRMIAGQFHRYRYIYAVEQFKRYHADEQWVAFGEDVFEDPNDKYLRELKHQCIVNGFGLIKVDTHEEPHLLISPSRHEVFKGKRRDLNFLTQGKWFEKMKFKNSPTWWVKTLNFIQNTGGPGSVLRFQKSFWNQILVTTVAMVLAGVIFYREIQDADLVHVDRTTYLEDLSGLKEETFGNGEEKIFVVDTSVNVAVDTQKFWDEDDFRAISGRGVSPRRIAKRKALKGREVIVGQGNEAPITYDCARFSNLRGTIYILSEGIYETASDALERLVILESEGLSVNILWLGCFDEKDTDYAVYLNEFYGSEDTAENQFFKFSQIDSIDFNDLKIKTLEIE